MMKKLAKSILTVLLLAVVTWSCSDNGTGAEPENPPEVPDIEAAQPDFSYFDSQAKVPDQIQAGEAFSNAQGTVLGASFMVGIGQLGPIYLEMARDEEAEFEDGQWVWSYNATYEGQTVGFKLTSTVNEDANEVQWAYYMSSSGGETEIEEFKYMEGTTSLDGNTGNWKIYEFGNSTSSEAMMAYEWNIDDDENLTASFEFPSDDANTSLNYEQDGSQYTLSINGSDGSTEVYWDIENDQGYWWNKVQDEKLCWSSGKANIACSDIGL